MMTRPVVLSEILWKGELIGYEHTTRLAQWLSSIFIMNNSRYTKGDYT